MAKISAQKRRRMLSNRAQIRPARPPVKKACGTCGTRVKKSPLKPPGGFSQ